MESSTGIGVKETLDNVMEKAVDSENMHEIQTTAVSEEIESGLREGAEHVHSEVVKNEETIKNEIHGEIAEIKSGTDMNDNQFTVDMSKTITTTANELKDDGVMVMDEAGHLSDKKNEVLNSIEDSVSADLSNFQTGVSSVTDPVRTKLFTSYEEEMSQTENHGLNSKLEDSVHAAAPVTEAEEGGSTLETVVGLVTTAVESIQDGATIQETARTVVTEVVTGQISPKLSSQFSPVFPSPSNPAESTESRDNPFIPDGELSKETDELLKRATIIRDKFYLDQQERKERGLDSTDDVNPEKSPVQESVVAPVSAQAAHATAKGFQPATAEVKPRMRENGKVEDSVSPEGVKPEIEKGAVAPIVDGSKTSPEASGDNDKEKKKQKKCCSIM